MLCTLTPESGGQMCMFCDHATLTSVFFIEFLSRAHGHAGTCPKDCFGPQGLRCVIFEVEKKEGKKAAIKV